MMVRVWCTITGSRAMADPPPYGQVLPYMQILDPTGDTSIEQQTLAARLSDLRGKNVWFCDNQGIRSEPGAPPDVNPLFSRWRERLLEDHGIKAHHACTDQFTSPYRHGREMFEKIAKEADVVINELACCGSGTSAVIHDAVRFEVEGVPTVSLITSNVEGFAKATMRRLGLNDLPYLMTSHRIHVFSLVSTLEEAHEDADRLYPQLVSALLPS